MKKEYVLFGGISILIGIIILYCNSLFSAHLELVHSVGINLISDYHLSYYAIACFVIGLVFIILSFWEKIKE